MRYKSDRLSKINLTANLVSLKEEHGDTVKIRVITCEKYQEFFSALDDEGRKRLKEIILNIFPEFQDYKAELERLVLNCKIIDARRKISDLPNSYPEGERYLDFMENLEFEIECNCRHTHCIIPERNVEGICIQCLRPLRMDWISVPNRRDFS